MYINLLASLRQSIRCFMTNFETEKNQKPKENHTNKTCENPVLCKREYKFVDFLLTDARIIPISFNLDKLFWTLLLTTVVVDLIGY